MGLFRALSNAIFREYDRRVKRASLITEYGASHHAHDDHDEHAEHADEEAAEIVNLPRGASLTAPTLGEAAPTDE